jgi:hypothetical protein
MKGNKPNCRGFKIKAKYKGDNLNNVRREASRYFRNRKREYLKNIIS